MSVLGKATEFLNSRTAFWPHTLLQWSCIHIWKWYRKARMPLLIQTFDLRSTQVRQMLPCPILLTVNAALKGSSNFANIYNPALLSHSIQNHFLQLEPLGRMRYQSTQPVMRWRFLVPLEYRFLRGICRQPAYCRSSSTISVSNVEVMVRTSFNRLYHSLWDIPSCYKDRALLQKRPLQIFWLRSNTCAGFVTDWRLAGVPRKPALTKWGGNICKSNYDEEDIAASAAMSIATSEERRGDRAYSLCM